MVFKCGNIKIDERAHEVRREGAVVDLEPKVFELILYLIRHRDRVVPRQELFDVIWAGTVVGEAALSRCVYLARKALGDAELIKVAHRRGYRFVGAVVEVNASTELMRTVEAVVERVERAQGRGGHGPSVGEASSSSRSSKLRDPAVPAFIGRAPELAVAEERLQLAIAGRGGVCLVVGEAGIGKTRFLLEFMGSVSMRKLLLARGESLDAAGAPAYWPWLQVFRRLARALPAEGDELAAAGKDLERVAEALALDEGGGRAAEARGNRLLFFERVGEILNRAARARPLVLLFDDLHYADLASLHLFGFIANALASAPVLLLGAYRAGDLERDPERSIALAPMLNGENCTIQLKGLSVGDVEALLRGRVDPARLEEMARALHARTAGNPFFLTQLIPLVAEDGFSPGSGQVPSGLREVIRRRLEELDPECAELLRVASVFGTRFNGDWVGTGRYGGDRVVDHLELAIGNNLLRRVNDAPTFEFVHGLIRDALYEDLGVSRRAALHCDAAAFFETCVGLDEERRLAALAHHYCRSLPLGDGERALSCMIRAGTLAQGRYAHEVAIDYFTQALRILESGAAGDEEQYFTVLLDLGTVQMHAGQHEAAKVTLDRAAELARRLGLADGLARVALCIGPPVSLIESMVDDHEVKLLQDALELLQEGDRRLCALLKARLAIVQTTTKDWHAKMALCEDAAWDAACCSDDAVEARILCARLAALWRPDNMTDRISWLNAALEHVERVRDYETALGSQQFRFILALERGDLASARAAIDGLVRTCAEVQLPAFLGEGYACALAFAEGRLSKAEELCSTILRVSERTGLHSPLQAFGAVFSLIRIERGAAEDVLQVLRYFGNQYKEMVGWSALLTYALARAGRHAEARLQLDRLAEHDFPIPEDRTWLACMAMLSEVCADMGDVRHANVLYTRLVAFGDRHASAGAISLGSMHRFLALLGVVQRDEAAACAHFEAAIESNTRAGARLALAYAQHGYSALLAVSPDHGTQVRARKLREQALEGARECGSVYLAQQIERAGRPS